MCSRSVWDGTVGLVPESLNKAPSTSRGQRPSPPEHPPPSPGAQAALGHFFLRSNAVLGCLQAVARLGQNKMWLDEVVYSCGSALPETLLYPVSPAAVGWPCVTPPKRHSVGHCASSLAIQRSLEGGASSSPFWELIVKLPGDVWSSEKLCR